MSSKSIYNNERRRDLIENPPRVASIFSKEEWEHIVMNELCDEPFMSGKTHSLETRALMSQNHSRYWLGKKKPKEIGEKISISNTGKKHNNETKKLMSSKHSGKGNPFYGKTHSEENRKKMGHQKRCQRIKIGNRVFDSQVEASKYYNVCKATITKWVKIGKAKRI